MLLKELNEQYNRETKEELLKDLKDKQEAKAMYDHLGKGPMVNKMQLRIDEIKSKLAKLK